MFNIFKSAPKNYEDLDGSTFKTKNKNALNAELLDVRTAGEFASGTIPGASNLDVTSPQFQQALQQLDKGKEYFVFCRSGNRSGSACDLMTAHGFKAYNLSGGISAWPH
ncbi:rhodanese-like domain-containing protein [Pontibacter sp. KCTC 32443]|uniref:rhodanese-like domain-containing protein n=1 Tax=Pontibacter TaxID=323449 RepID=UPI00164E8AA1|nr:MULTISPECIES: rhodanese-like domain-containing protein [Pontibacter]MBC5773086.1 rhodanese-like domain-containing protein [Pontibacter sp. KCTC 32443]